MSNRMNHGGPSEAGDCSNPPPMAHCVNEPGLKWRLSSTIGPTLTKWPIFSCGNTTHHTGYPIRECLLPTRILRSYTRVYLLVCFPLFYKRICVTRSEIQRRLTLAIHSWQHTPTIFGEIKIIPCIEFINAPCAIEPSYLHFLMVRIRTVRFPCGRVGKKVIAVTPP